MEISNASLLAINATLERAKQKQATEIRSLRHQLQDAPLLSPSISHTFADSETAIEDDERDINDLLDQDADFKSIVACLEGLIKKGEEAIHGRPLDSPSKESKRVLAPVQNGSDLGVDSSISSSSSNSSRQRSDSLFCTPDASFDFDSIAGHSSESSQMSEPDGWTSGVEPLSSPFNSPFMRSKLVQVDATPLAAQSNRARVMGYSSRTPL